MLPEKAAVTPTLLGIPGSLGTLPPGHGVAFPLYEGPSCDSLPFLNLRPLGPAAPRLPYQVKAVVAE